MHNSRSPHTALVAMLALWIIDNGVKLAQPDHSACSDRKNYHNRVGLVKPGHSATIEHRATLLFDLILTQPSVHAGYRSLSEDALLLSDLQAQHHVLQRTANEHPPQRKILP